MLNLTDQQEVDIINAVTLLVGREYTIMDYNIIDKQPYVPGKPCQLIDFELKPKDKEDYIHIQFNARKLLRNIRNDKYRRRHEQPRAD